MDSSLIKIKLLIYLFSFAAATLFALAGYGAFRKGLKRYEEKYLSKTAQALDEMFLIFSPEQVLYLNLLSIFLLATFGFLFTQDWKWTMIFGIVGFFIPKAVLKIAKNKRLKRFDSQLVDGLSTLSNSLKAGFSLVQALEMLAREMNPPISQEFGLMLRENKLGIPLDKALMNMTERIPSNNLELVVTSIIIARTAGGNLAEIFDQIASTVREISRLEGKIDALTAQGKLQGWILGSLPVALGYLIYVLDEEMMSTLWVDPLGWGIIGIIVLFETIGGFFIWRIVSIDI
ncbi:type II secretion system F family protein [candidate division CSSED10-310 bacterium]|uniref:Type II secretion system F family protein n=1 Tax=candidate division CSSED10-310 bacterium TaxID=2855610 RepID=A0ABV6YXQ8_UNCC1